MQGEPTVQWKEDPPEIMRFFFGRQEAADGEDVNCLKVKAMKGYCKGPFTR